MNVLAKAMQAIIHLYNLFIPLHMVVGTGGPQHTAGNGLILYKSVSIIIIRSIYSNRTIINSAAHFFTFLHPCIMQ